MIQALPLVMNLIGRYVTKESKKQLKDKIVKHGREVIETKQRAVVRDRFLAHAAWIAEHKVKERDTPLERVRHILYWCWRKAGIPGEIADNVFRDHYDDEVLEEVLPFVTMETPPEELVRRVIEAQVEIIF